MVATVLVAAIALLHVYILVLEMFLWTTKRGRAAFGTTVETAEITKVMAANQGLYNGFLAAGLMWSLFLGVLSQGRAQAFFFLGCIFVAGIYGAMTASRKILFIQSVPAALALVAVIFNL
jgi:putative membrane protein